MDYQNTLTYLYNSVPMFQQVGGSAYKEGLETHVYWTNISDIPTARSAPSMWREPTAKVPVRTRWPPYCRKPGIVWDFTLPPTWWTSANVSV